MRYGSVCSGIEAATVAWHPLGWRPAFFSEIEAFPRAVLAHHYPEVPLHGDFTTIGASEYGAIDLLVGGTPCQSFSVAGLRGGLADDRGNLALEYLRLADRKRPRWLVWENVPGVLSSNGGRDFGSILGGLVELGYGFSYRVLDAQYAGVPQRRRRVFVVGCAGDWRPAAAVLFERHSLQGHSAPSRKAGQGITPILEAGARTGVSTTDIRAGIGIGEPGDAMFTLQAGKQHAIASTGEISHCLNAGGMGRQDYETETLIAFEWQRGASQNLEMSDGFSPALIKSQTPAIHHLSAVRRLTPRECERLQGFPDDYTAIPHRGKPASDGPRYKALGNSMAVPVMRWIGERMALVDQLTNSLEQAA